MSEQITSSYADAGRQEEPPPRGWATGFIMFAAIMMTMACGLQSRAGSAALFEDDFYVATPNYLRGFDTTMSWTWVIGPVGTLLAVPFSLLTTSLLVGAESRGRWAPPLTSGKPEAASSPEPEQAASPALQFKASPE